MSSRKPNPKFDVWKLRQEMGLSRVALAHALAVDKRSIRRWENEGVAPRGYHLTRLKRLAADFKQAAKAS